MISDTLLSLGLAKKHIKKCYKTGLVVDIMGTGKPDTSLKSGCHVVALRADIDALPMPEKNKDLPYRTQTDHAHMCGHDGHIACLVAAASIFIAKRDKVPSNKGVRLLF